MRVEYKKAALPCASPMAFHFIEVVGVLPTGVAVVVPVRIEVVVIVAAVVVLLVWVAAVVLLLLVLFVVAAVVVFWLPLLLLLFICLTV